MSRDLLDLVRELNTLNDYNLADRVISNNDVQWCLSELQDILEAEQPTLTPPNEPLTQADLDVMDYDKVWIDYEDGTGEWALVCNGYIYSIDTLEGAGFDFTDYMRGEKLEPHGYKVYHRQPEGEEDAQ